MAKVTKVENIKCPSCGSTAQVREGDIYTTPNGAYFEQVCTCGCGCRFIVNYPRVINMYCIREEK